MPYLKCLGVGLFLALVGGFAWLLYLFASVGSNIPADTSGGGVSVDVRSVFDSRSLMIVLIFFVAGFFLEFLLVKRRLVHSR
jgi:predicted permease